MLFSGFHAFFVISYEVERRLTYDERPDFGRNEIRVSLFKGNVPDFSHFISVISAGF
jgi:hypothetical protein